MSEEDVVEDLVDSDISEVEETSTEGEPVEQNQPEEVVDPLEEALQGLISLKKKSFTKKQKFRI